MSVKSINRQGNFLVVVMGLISLFLALTIGLTIKVKAGMLQVGNVQKTAQSIINTSIGMP